MFSMQRKAPLFDGDTYQQIPGTIQMSFRSAIKFYHSLGKLLYVGRLFIMLLIILGGAFSIFLIFSSSELSGKYLLLAILFTTWLILLLSLAYFRADDLLLDQKKMSWLKKISHSIRWVFAIVLIAAFNLLGLALLWMSISAISRLYS